MKGTTLAPTSLRPEGKLSLVAVEVGVPVGAVTEAQEPCSIRTGRQERLSRKSEVSITASGAEATFLGLLVCQGDFWSFPDSPGYTVLEPGLPLA